VSINYSHQLAKVICFKTPDDFKLFPWFLFRKIKVNLGQYSPNWWIKVIFDGIIGSSR
jgi:hypothetical protein